VKNLREGSTAGDARAYVQKNSEAHEEFYLRYHDKRISVKGAKQTPLIAFINHHELGFTPDL
jgi:hypothetical protein